MKIQQIALVICLTLVGCGENKNEQYYGMWNCSQNLANVDKSQYINFTLLFEENFSDSEGWGNYEQNARIHDSFNDVTGITDIVSTGKWKADEEADLLDLKQGATTVKNVDVSAKKDKGVRTTVKNKIEALLKESHSETWKDRSTFAFKTSFPDEYDKEILELSTVSEIFKCEKE